VLIKIPQCFKKKRNLYKHKKIFGGGDKKQKQKIENKGFLLFTPLIDLNAGKAVFVWYSLCSVRQCCKGCATPFRSSCPCTNVFLQSLVPLHCKKKLSLPSHVPFLLTAVLGALCRKLRSSVHCIVHTLPELGSPCGKPPTLPAAALTVATPGRVWLTLAGGSRKSCAKSFPAFKIPAHPPLKFKRLLRNVLNNYI